MRVKTLGHASLPTYLYLIDRVNFCTPVATVNIEGTTSSLSEGDIPGTTVAQVRLTINPTVAILGEDIIVSVAVMTGGGETAVGED